MARVRSKARPKKKQSSVQWARGDASEKAAFVQLVFWLADWPVTKDMQEDIVSLARERRRVLIRALHLRGRPPEPRKDLWAYLRMRFSDLTPVEIAGVSGWEPTRHAANAKGTKERLRSTLTEAHIKRGKILRSYLHEGNTVLLAAAKFVRHLEETGQLVPTNMPVALLTPAHPRPGERRESGSIAVDRPERKNGESLP